jgi:hypothetical protein
VATMPTIHANEASRTATLTGSLFVALAAFGFSAKAILVKLAYFHQVDAVTLLALRMAFALPEGAQDVRRPPRSRRAGCFVEVCSSIAGGDKT